MERNKNHSDSSFHYERTETTEESTSVPTEPCMEELQQLLSVTLERSHLDIRKLQQAANDFRLCAKTFKICDVKLEQGFLKKSSD